jgi:hypothetical protein
MNPQLVVAILSSLPQLITEFQSLKLSGQVTVEDQQKVAAAIAALRAQDFSGPEWKIE